MVVTSLAAVPGPSESKVDKMTLTMEEASAANMQPTSNFLNAMLTDMYQITMCYAHWRGGRHMENSVFDYFFRKNPFQVHLHLRFWSLAISRL
jgi:hypothetical protein